MNFLQTIYDLRVRSLIITFTLLWLPNALRVYCRNINTYETYSNQLNTLQRQILNLKDATADKVIAEKVKELINRRDITAKENILKTMSVFNITKNARDNGLRFSLKERDSLESAPRQFKDFVKNSNSARLAHYTDILKSKVKRENVNRKHINQTAEVVDTEAMTDSVGVDNAIKDIIGSEVKSTAQTEAMKIKRGIMSPDACETELIEIELEFSEHKSTETSSYLLVCKGRVRVNKCEGLCNSSVSPSVNHYDGFQRECTCCKEVGVTRRPVMISTCTIGTEIVHGQSLTRTVVEPTSCSCQECRN